ncbi:YheC/YheD family endospore coat-associated protein [Candidatus Contubernalis alkaliaceticus]|uniref:YheC/YheD family endospore coat-associated protein n=1 Tax=Candidatus Contubernalis alkaliaceticus TaxID=338645 RepID=UPI001F4BD5A6|nr:YheC/YheD family protein [Candidatus Contubernalis alkalaceticus]UNC92311.1 YheC/YheD family protein [Candidatus Contubernalis alkalaceticus]
MKCIWLKSLKPNQIAINSNLFNKFNRPKSLVINIGMLKMKLNVIIKNDILDNYLALSTNLTDKYTIPENIPYEIYYKEGALYLGPVIAYVSSGSKQFKKKSYAFNLPVFLDYNSIKGLIITCTESSINVDSGIVEGYYLDPNAKNLKNAWRYGKFPLPNAMFNRSFMPQKKIRAIQNKIGNKIFNSYLLNLDKWQTWEFLSKDDTLKKHLPYTEKFLGIEQLKSLLNQYGSLYLKPSNNSGGIGIMKVDKLKNGITLIDNRGKAHHFSKYKMLSEFLKNRISYINEQSVDAKTNSRFLSQFLGNKLKTPFIVQQSVHFEINNQQVDFRIILQKNSKMKWASSGLVGRIAQEGSIITNKRGRKKMISGRKALTSIYGVSEKRAKRIELEITNIIIRVVKMYEKLGFHLGDVAADITLDSNLNIWLLELQLYYSITGWHTKGLRKLYEKVATTPFKYAKALAGF